MKKTILKELKKDPKVMINIRLTEEEKKIIEDKAEQFTGGNITALIKYAVLKFSPSQRDLAKI